MSLPSGLTRNITRFIATPLLSLFLAVFFSLPSPAFSSICIFLCTPCPLPLAGGFQRSGGAAKKQGNVSLSHRGSQGWIPTECKFFLSGWTEYLSLTLPHPPFLANIYHQYKMNVYLGCYEFSCCAQLNKHNANQ